MTEEIKQKLNRAFVLAAGPINEGDGSGYRIHLSAPWHDTGLNVQYYEVKLCGINPITGLDVAEDQVVAQFDFAQIQYRTPVLTYHGVYQLRCSAYLTDGTEIHLRDQEIVLDYPQNSPFLRYSVTGANGFRQVRLESNCWKSCQGKIWLKYDGHQQLVRLPVRTDNSICLVVPTSGEVKVNVQNKMIQVKTEG